jgi:methionyl-tRNA formyltransferase
VPAFQRIALFGDSYGIPMCLELLHPERIACVVVAERRPQHIEPVRELAEPKGIPLIIQRRQTSGDYGSFVRSFVESQPDFLLCHSYSMKVPAEILRAVHGQAVNLHPALLPKNRGPNPIQWAIIRGETQTGVTLHYMDEAIDAGDVIAQRAVPIDVHDTWVTVFDKIDAANRHLLTAELPSVVAGTNSRHPQSDALATTNHRLNPDSPKIDFDRMNDRQIYDLIRAQVAPLAGAYVELADGSQVRFRELIPLDEIRSLRARYAKLELRG